MPFPIDAQGVTEIVTPEIAGRWLDGYRYRDTVKLERSDNRLIEGYGRDMASGQWPLNGDPIIFDDKGCLVKGYRRLRACVDFNASFASFVIRGVDDRAANTIGTHRKRRAADVLHISGRDYPVPICSMVNALNFLSRGQTIAVSTSLSGVRIDQICQSHPDIGQLFYAEWQGPLSIFIAPSTMCAIRYAAASGEPAKAEGFFGEMTEGAEAVMAVKPRPGMFERADEARAIVEGVQLTKTVKAVLLAMIDIAAKPLEELDSRDRREQTAAVLIKGWNAYCDGVAIDSVAWDKEEPFPRISGMKDLPDFSPALPPVKDTRATLVAAIHENQLTCSLQTLSVAEMEHLVSKEQNGPLIALVGVRNRAVSRGHVEKLCQDMVKGRFEVNGQTVKISKSGQLLDGQHRLLAAIKAGKPLTTFVVRGLPDAVFATFDAGKMESPAVKLRRLGFKGGAAAIAVRVTRLVVKHALGGFAEGVMPTNAEIVAFAEANQENIQAAVDVGRKVEKKRVTPSHPMGAVYYVVARSEPERAERFAYQTWDGSELKTGSPVLLMRDKLQSELALGTKRGLADSERLRVLIQGWNGFYAGQDTIRFQMKGPFPKILGLRDPILLPPVDADFPIPLEAAFEKPVSEDDADMAPAAETPVAKSSTTRGGSKPAGAAKAKPRKASTVAKAAEPQAAAPAPQEPPVEPQEADVAASVTDEPIVEPSSHEAAPAAEIAASEVAASSPAEEAVSPEALAEEPAAPVAEAPAAALETAPEPVAAKPAPEAEAPRAAPARPAAPPPSGKPSLLEALRRPIFGARRGS